MLQEQSSGSLMSTGLLKAPLCVYEEDFIDLSVVDSIQDDLQANWKWTASGVGADIPNRDSFKDEAFGVLRISTGTGDNSYVTGQKAQEWIIPTTGKRILFKCRFNVTDATQSDFMIGIMDTAATDLLGGIQDGIYFRKDDGDALLDFVVETSATATSTVSLLTVVADTDMELSFEYLPTGAGTGKVWVYVDGQPINGLQGKYYSSGTPNALMSVGVGIRAGEAAQKHMDLDYIGVVVERS